MKTVFYSFLLTILLMSCSNKTKTTIIEMSPDNPFNIELNEPIDYANVTGDFIEEYVDVSIENVKQDIESIKKELESLGYDRNGNEYLYNGMTGKKMKSKIFIGPTYYQRLKQIIPDTW